MGKRADAQKMSTEDAILEPSNTARSLAHAPNDTEIVASPAWGIRAAEVARRLGASTSFVRDHREELGGVRGPDGVFLFREDVIEMKKTTIRRRAAIGGPSPGSIAGVAFESFRRGTPLDVIVSELQVEPTTIARLYDEFQALARINVVRPTGRYRIEWHRGAHVRDSTLRLEEFEGDAWRTLEGWCPEGGDPERDTLVIPQGGPVPANHERVEIPIAILKTYAALPGEKKATTPKPPPARDDRTARDAFAQAFAPKGKR